MTDVQVPSAPASFTRTERSLILSLLDFPSVLSSARTAHMPHQLATYLFTLAQSFSAFYTNDPILTAEDNVRDMRLYLTHLVRSVLKTGAGLLTLRVPERM